MKPSFSRHGWLLCLAACVWAAGTAPGVILLETGDPTRNTSTPGDGSGWEYEGVFGAFLGTPIAPRYFLTATHIGNQGDFVFHGETYKTVGNPAYDPGSDLVIWQVDHDFADYAPLFTAASANEAGQVLNVTGRGTQRGSEMDLAGTARGWAWGPADAVERWGRNVVADILTDNNAAATQYLHATFDLPGVPNEAHLSAGDSGGGLFVREDGLWKLAAINYGVDDLYTGADGSGQFVAALFDARGYRYNHGDGTYPLIEDDGDPVPTGFYSTRVAARLAWIRGITGLDPAALPPENFAAWQTLYFTPAQRADDLVSGTVADPDGDGVSNLLEFAFNLDPTYPEPVVMTAGTGVRGLPLVRLESVAATGDNRLTVEYVRRTAAGGGSLTYQAQFATDLAAGDWQAGGTETVTAINARWERVKVVDGVASGTATSGRRFARVAVTMEAPMATAAAARRVGAKAIKK